MKAGETTQIKKGRLVVIPGMGADFRLFAGISFPNWEMEILDYIPHRPGESLRDYALRMLDGVPKNEAFALLGVSMGGMLAVEMAKERKVEKLVLISSAKGRSELPWRLRIQTQLPLLHLLPSGIVPYFYGLASWAMGIKNKKGRDLFVDMSRKARVAFFKWAIVAIGRWDNQEHPKCLHIHGTKDLVLPVLGQKNVIWIEGGTHWIIQQQKHLIIEKVSEYLEA